ncbi:hypothetical protein SAMN02745163_04350 [Clostridium cavendishii DSM 21758]|uniref:Uncharacterized protein n=1 Tax=Clostridium cavendishii DSM 21758 TaxID=1121302 RepID=A0A1M6UU45_9CLOT|nr:hypothetical protein [Clostridium cavendishii]SHK72748.1 hypothetical protein SAMN02745163_04350 [Clostridium cavendishii DSM 21758]
MMKRGFKIVGRFILAFIISDLIMRINLHSEHLITNLTSNKKRRFIRKVFL